MGAKSATFSTISAQNLGVPAHLKQEESAYVACVQGEAVVHQMPPMPHKPDYQIQNLPHSIHRNRIRVRHLLLPVHFCAALHGPHICAWPPEVLVSLRRLHTSSKNHQNIWWLSVANIVLGKTHSCHLVWYLAPNAMIFRCWLRGHYTEWGPKVKPLVKMHLFCIVLSFNPTFLLITLHFYPKQLKLHSNSSCIHFQRIHTWP